MEAFGLAALGRLGQTIAAQDAYHAGYDAGMNGANTTNCHFAIFSTPEKAKEWERGKAAAERIRAAGVSATGQRQIAGEQCRS